jgi:hypothetical protein
MFGPQLAGGSGGWWGSAGQGASQEIPVPPQRTIQPQYGVLRLGKPPVNKKISYHCLGFGRQFRWWNVSVVSTRAETVPQRNNSNAVLCFRRKVASVIPLGLAGRS